MGRLIQLIVSDFGMISYFLLKKQCVFQLVTIYNRLKITSVVPKTRTTYFFQKL